MTMASAATPGMALTLAGEAMTLDPAPALIWPRERTAFVADTHFGKGAAMRRGGVALPGGTSSDDLDRVAALVDRHALERLVVLGDFFHTPPMPGDPFIAAFTAWRRRYRELTITVVRGNHDRPSGDALPSLIEWQSEGLSLGPLVLCHEPVTSEHGHVLAGHEHPVTVLRGDDGDRLRVPVFRLLAGLTILPAFGGLTGGYATRPATDERRVAVTPAGLFELPA